MPGEFCGAGGTPNVCAAAPVYRFGFVSYRDGYSNIYLQDSGATPRTVSLTSNRVRMISHSRLSFRPDGQRIAFNALSTLIGPPPWAMIGRDFETSAAVFGPLDRDPEHDGVDNYIPYSVDWNETGDKIAFLAQDVASGRNVLMVDMSDPENADHTHVEVPNDRGTREFDKVVWWHWNGAAETRLVFSMKEGREPYDLYVRDMSNPSGVIRRIDFGGASVYDKKDPAVGPFAQLAYVLTTSAGSHLVTCNLNFSWSPPVCGSLTYYSRTLAAHVSSPSWSPDGRYLFFVSDHDGNPEIYMMSLASSEVKRLTDNRVQDSDVACLPAPMM